MCGYSEMANAKPTVPLGNRSNLTRIVFTINNYTDDDVNLLRTGVPNVRSLIFGREKGESGTPHLQGAALFTKPTKFSTVRKALPRAHIERMKGTPSEAFEYCRKDGDYEQIGEPITSQGKRSDLDAAVLALKNGATLQDLAEGDHASTLVRNYRGLSSLFYHLQQGGPLRTKRVIWLYGPTGAGKTESAVEFAKQHKLSYWISGRDLQWFDGYVGQHVAIFDDFRWKHAPFSFFLRLLDRYELSVPIKGGFARWNPSFIFITTPKTITETFDYEFRDPEDLRQVSRRVHHVMPIPEEKNSIIWQTLKLFAQDALSKSTPTHGGPNQSCNSDS
jgi:hypothetical protein